MIEGLGLVVSQEAVDRSGKRFCVCSVPSASAEDVQTNNAFTTAVCQGNEVALCVAG